MGQGLWRVHPSTGRQPIAARMLRSRIPITSPAAHRLLLDDVQSMDHGVGTPRSVSLTRPTSHVRDVMTGSPITIAPEASLQHAADVMRDREVRHLPVVDSTGRLLGVISDRDLRSAAFAPAMAEYLPPEQQAQLAAVTEAFADLRVRDAMTWRAITIEPSAQLAEAAAVMFVARVGCLPVVANGRLLGIITERDVLRALADTLPAVRGFDPDTYLG
jgi:CBS domain-containing protein